VVGGGVFENVARMVRGSDVTVCSAGLLSLRHVAVAAVVRGLSSLQLVAAVAFACQMLNQH
jgi:hypothetical protein